MSSRVFAARSSHRPHDPQLCGLSDLTGCNPIQRGEMCLYLTCLGDAAQPVAQIERSGREDGFSTGFRVVASGRTRTVSVGTRFERQVPVFKWQQRDAQGRWHDVVVWERMVHADCARRMGYGGRRAVRQAGTRRRGDRARDRGHGRDRAVPPPGTRLSPGPFGGPAFLFAHHASPLMANAVSRIKLAR